MSNTERVLKQRVLKQVVPARPSTDGAGVKISRLAGGLLQRMMDPFLMLDEIHSDNAADYLAGFPEHPHRGFETITYMKAGRMRHKDHMGHEGVIEAGDVQWMTAGRGVIHSEMPEQEAGLLHGFQIWLNLPAGEKMKPAAYRDFTARTIAEIALAAPGSRLRLVAGTVKLPEQQRSLTGPLPAMTTEPVLMDVMLQPGQVQALTFNSANPALVYVYQGALSDIDTHHAGFFEPGETLTLRAGAEGAGVLVLSGKPLKEPIAQYGPFVMNTREQLEQAMQDYRDGRLVEVG